MRMCMQVAADWTRRRYDIGASSHDVHNGDIVWYITHDVRKG